MAIGSLVVLQCVLCVLAPAASWQPVLSGVSPSGVQRGTTATMVFSGERLGGAQDVLLYDPGITITKVSNTDERTVAVEATIAPDCPGSTGSWTPSAS
jgi:hypothetical protein